MIGEKLKITYDGVECGFVTLKVKEGFNAYEFIFSEILSDPFPKLVNMFVRVRNGESCTEDFFDAYDCRIVVLRISARVEGYNVFLTIELVKENLTFNELYLREEFLTMIKRVFDGLLSDKYFPYSYPCFLYVSDRSGTSFSDAIMETMAKSRRDDSTGDLLNHAVETGRLKLEPHHKNFIRNYRRMLTRFIIPQDFFD